MTETYDSDLILGEKYRDNATGLVGTLTSIHFYQHACERATLRFLNGQGEVVESTFDAPELVRVKTQKAARASKPGGPARADGSRAAVSRA